MARKTREDVAIAENLRQIEKLEHEIKVRRSVIEALEAIRDGRKKGPRPVAAKGA